MCISKELQKKKQQQTNKQEKGLPFGCSRNTAENSDISMMTSFDYNYQNAFCYKLCYVDLCHTQGILHKRKNTKYNSLPQSILVLLVKWHHRANGPMGRLAFQFWFSFVTVAWYNDKFYCNMCLFVGECKAFLSGCQKVIKCDLYFIQIKSEVTP